MAKMQMSNFKMPDVPQNVGTMDRVIRSAIGSALLINWLNKENEGKSSAITRIGGVFGGLLLADGLLGFDPLLMALNTNTHPGDANNVARRVSDMTGTMGDRMGDVGHRIRERIPSRSNGHAKPSRMGRLAAAIR